MKQFYIVGEWPDGRKAMFENLQEVITLFWTLRGNPPTENKVDILFGLLLMNGVLKGDFLSTVLNLIGFSKARFVLLDDDGTEQTPTVIDYTNVGDCPHISRYSGEAARRLLDPTRSKPVPSSLFGDCYDGELPSDD
jgi:hypothetical protein